MENIEIVNTAATCLAMVSKPQGWVDAMTEGKNATLIEFFLPDEVKEAFNFVAENPQGGMATFESSLFLYTLLKGFELLITESQSPEGMAKMLAGTAYAQREMKEHKDGISES